MKKISALVCFTFFMQLCSAQIAIADTMVYKIFETLKAKDEKGFVALYPNDEQMLALMKKMVSAMKEELVKRDTVKKKKENQVNLDSLIIASFGKMATQEGIVEMKKGLVKNFRRFVEKGEAKGIDWSKARMIDYTIDTTLAVDERTKAIFGSDNYKRMEGTINFVVDTSSYQLSFAEIIYMPENAGWYGAEFRQLVRKGEKPEEEFEKSNGCFSL